MSNAWFIVVTTGGSTGQITATTTGSPEYKQFMSKGSPEYNGMIPVAGPYTSLAAAEKNLPAVVAYEKSSPGGTLTALESAGKAIVEGFQGTVTSGVSGGTENPSGQSPAAAPGWEQSLENFLNDISSVDFWLRALKIGVGGILLIVGLAHMTGIDKGIVGTAVKAAPFLG